ncbi:serine-rich aggregation substance UasX [Leuconostoc citreum]|uniref:serine-rich aggregation substance UasX n=1 Tax=Leuconostoc citreum TaxID=33964 RepID=UPI0032DEEE33
MLKQSMLVSGAVLGALTLGNQVVNADTVGVDDGTTVTQPSKPDDSSTPTTPTTPTQPSQPSQPSQPTTGGSDVDDGTHVDNGGNGSSTDNGGNSSSTDNGGNSSSTDNGGNGSSTDNGGNGSSTDNGGNGSSTDNGGNGSSTDNGGNGSSTDNGGNGGGSLAPDGNKLPTNGANDKPVTLTPATPDVNEQGQLNQVAPVQIKASSQGNAPVVPTQVATVPSVARAVQNYNAELDKNNNDGTKDTVQEAKKKVEQAVKEALPKTGVEEKSSSNMGLLATVVSALVGGLGFVFKKKFIK